MCPSDLMLQKRNGSEFPEINAITNIMKSRFIANIIALIMISSLLCSCTTVTYPNGTTVTTPYVAPCYGTYYPGYYGPPYGTGGVYGGGYFPVYGYGYGGCWNRPWYGNPWSGWNGWNRGNCWNGAYRPPWNGCASPAWNGYRGGRCYR